MQMHEICIIPDERDSIPSRGKDLSVPHCILTGSTAHPVGAGKSDHSSPSCVEVRNVWSYTSASRYVFMSSCLMNGRNNLINVCVCVQYNVPHVDKTCQQHNLCAL